MKRCDPYRDLAQHPSPSGESRAAVRKFDPHRSHPGDSSSLTRWTARVSQAAPAVTISLPGRTLSEAGRAFGIQTDTPISVALR